MKAEYKRDMNHNYLVLYGEEINTDSYQVRMLVGNVIPSLLKCRIQSMDGKYMIYYDITSRQSLKTLYEDRKLKIEDLHLIIGGFVRIMEDSAEYLMNPSQLVMNPEYIFIELEKQQVCFCFLPGYEKDIKMQFQDLTEYLLPKIDHEDAKAVTLGYGIYRRTLENGFHLEHIKEELYKTKNDNAEKIPEIPKNPWPDRIEEPIDQPESEEISSDFYRDTEKEQEKKRKPVHKILICLLCILAAAGFMALSFIGFLPHIGLEVILGIILVGMGIGMLIYLVVKRIKDRKSQEKVVEAVLNKRRDELDREFKREEINFQEKDVSVAENIQPEDFGETVVLSCSEVSGPASFVSREPGELATIYLKDDLTVIGKLENACDAVINLPTVSRIHAKVRKKENAYYLTDLNSRNGTSVNGRLLLPDEEYKLQAEDEVDFAQARYIFLQ